MPEKVITNFEKDIYKKYYPLVFSNCKKRLYDSNSIDDAVQSTFLMYIREQDTISSTLSSWLYWSSTSVCKVINREVTLDRELSAQSVKHQKNASEKKLFQEEETQIQLKIILDKLPKKKQEMLLMRFFDGMTYAQIALHFKSSEEGVRKMIEHTLNSLKEKIRRKDIVFSVFMEQFFQAKSGIENVLSSTGAKSEVFILQNTIKQQLIVKGVHKMILFSKLKMALILCITISLPISAILVADNMKQPEIIIENNNQNNQISENKTSPESENKLLGSWKLQTTAKGWQYPVGSTLTIKADGTFEIVILSQSNPNTPNRANPPVIGKYTTKDSTFSFEFNYDERTIVECNYLINDKILTFTRKSGSVEMKIEYKKLETK